MKVASEENLNCTMLTHFPRPQKVFNLALPVLLLVDVHDVEWTEYDFTTSHHQYIKIGY